MHDFVVRKCYLLMTYINEKEYKELKRLTKCRKQKKYKQPGDSKTRLREELTKN